MVESVGFLHHRQYMVSRNRKLPLNTFRNIGGKGERLPLPHGLVDGG